MKQGHDEAGEEQMADWKREDMRMDAWRDGESKPREKAAGLLAAIARGDKPPQPAVDVIELTAADLVPRWMIP